MLGCTVAAAPVTADFARAGSVAQEFMEGPALGAALRVGSRLAIADPAGATGLWSGRNGDAFGLGRSPASGLALSASAPTIAALMPEPAASMIAGEPPGAALLAGLADGSASVSAAGVRYHEDFEGGQAGSEWGSAMPVTRSEEFTQFAGPFGAATLTLSVNTSPGAAYTMEFDVVLPGAPCLEVEMEGSVGVSLGERELLSRGVQGMRVEQAETMPEGDQPQPRVVRHVRVPFIAASETTTLRFAGAVPSGEPGSGWGIDNVIIDGGEQSATSGVGETSLVRSAGFLSTVPLLSPDLGGGVPHGFNFNSGGESGDGGGGGGGGGGDQIKNLPAPGVASFALVAGFLAIICRRR